MAAAQVSKSATNREGHEHAAESITVRPPARSRSGSIRSRARTFRSAARWPTGCGGAATPCAGTGTCARGENAPFYICTTAAESADAFAASGERDLAEQVLDGLDVRPAGPRSRSAAASAGCFAPRGTRAPRGRRGPLGGDGSARGAILRGSRERRAARDGRHPRGLRTTAFDLVFSHIVFQHVAPQGVRRPLPARGAPCSGREASCAFRWTDVRDRCSDVGRGLAGPASSTRRAS
jgi:hypothetical protein